MSSLFYFFSVASQELYGDVSHLFLPSVTTVSFHQLIQLYILTYRKWFVPAITRTEAVQKLVTEVGARKQNQTLHSITYDSANDV